MAASCIPDQLLGYDPGEWRHLLDWRFTSPCKYLYSNGMYRTAQFFIYIFIILIIWLCWALIMHAGSLISLVPLRDLLVVAGEYLVAGYAI